jgi:DNA mismatch repair protein MutL
MARINQLSPSVINKIAAGEVIERPASVVKELLENSVDALATRIEVDVVDGGAELIRISDDGEGIHPDDVLLAVTCHATSKLVQADDLYRVQTMGFRGEALASIAEVSNFRLRTRQADRDSGTELEVNGGLIAPIRECGCPVGTTIEVKQIFFNTPVRRKFLRSSGTELGHICEQFTRIALANPRLHLVLRHNQKVVYELPATDKLQDRLRLFYGPQLADQLIWVESSLNNHRIWGYVAHPSQNKATRKGEYLFLNGRWIQDRSLQHALTESYRGLLMVGRYPIAFLFLEMPPELVDVNVHPTKAEVRFQDSQQLYRLLLSALRTKFLSMNLESQIKLPGGSANRADAAKPDAPIPEPQKSLPLRAELAEWAGVQAGFPVAASVLSPNFGSSLSAPATASGGGSPVMNSVLRSLSEQPFKPFPEDSFRTAPRPASADPGNSQSDWNATGASSTVLEEPGLQGTSTTSTSESSLADRHPLPADQFNAQSLAQENPFEAPTTATADTAAIHEPASSSGSHANPANTVAGQLSPMRAMQVHDCYLVLETDEGLTVIDQHALHERIMYEHLRERVLAGGVESQRLLLPETIDLSPPEASSILEHASTLAQIGLDVADFGGHTVLLSRYPVMLGKLNLVQLVKDIAQQLCDSGLAPTRRDILDELLHMMSCKAAIKAGQRLKQEEIESLLAQRHLIDDAHHCPHGRPSSLTLSRSELDRQFGRLG